MRFVCVIGSALNTSLKEMMHNIGNIVEGFKDYCYIKLVIYLFVVLC